MFTVLFLDGHAHVPGEVELARLANQIEIFDRIEGASEELRQAVAQRFPDLLHKMQPTPKIWSVPGKKSC